MALVTIRKPRTITRGNTNPLLSQILIKLGSDGGERDIHHRVSETLAQYLRLADDVDGQRGRTLVAVAQSRGDNKTLDWWQAIMDTKRKGYNTTIRLWRLRKPRRRG